MLLHKDFCSLPPVLPWARACEPSLSHWRVVIPSSTKLLPCHTSISSMSFHVGWVGQVCVLEVSETENQDFRNYSFSLEAWGHFKSFLLVIFPLAIRNVNTVFSLIGVFKSKEALRKSLYPQVSRGRHGLLSPWRLSFWSGGPGCELVGIAWQEIGAISRPQFVVDNKRIWTLTLCKIEMSGLSLFVLLKCSVSGLSIGVSLE